MERGDFGRRLLVWDAPDMDRGLAEVLGQRPSAANRPNLPAVLRWARTRSGRTEPLEAAVFCIVPHGLEATMAPWVVNLRHHGFAVFAKPTASRRDAVGPDLVRHVDRCAGQGRLVELVVASHDGSTLRKPLRRWRAAGVDVVVLGYRERGGVTGTDAELAFVDVEDVPDAFDHPLPRTDLFDLPRTGRWFDPLNPDGPPDPAATNSALPAPDRRTAPAQPASAKTSAELLALIEAEVAASMAGGSGGLTLRQVGDVVRTHFDARSLADLGFPTVAGLVERLEAAGPVRLVRLADGCHLLTLDRAASSPAVPPPAPAPPPPPAPAPEAPPAPAPPAAPPPESAPADETRPTDEPSGGDHPIYRIFRGHTSP